MRYRYMLQVLAGVCVVICVPVVCRVWKAKVLMRWLVAHSALGSHSWGLASWPNLHRQCEAQAGLGVVAFIPPATVQGGKLLAMQLFSLFPPDHWSCLWCKENINIRRVCDTWNMGI